MKIIQTINSSAGKLETEETPISAIYDYVAEQIPAFIDEVDKALITNEKGLTQKLLIQLNTADNNLDYYFHPEYLADVTSGMSPAIDFAVISKADKSKGRVRIGFEAKRLDSTLPKAREKEYAIGQYDGEGTRIKNSGAIERFKNGTHGKDVNYGGIIGFMQNGTYKEWHDKISGWIKQEIQHPSDPSLEWESHDIPSELSELKTKMLHTEAFTSQRYTSASKRKTKTPIRFQHFWIDLTQQKGQ